MVLPSQGGRVGPRHLIIKQKPPHKGGFFISLSLLLIFLALLISSLHLLFLLYHLIYQDDYLQTIFGLTSIIFR